MFYFSYIEGLVLCQKSLAFTVDWAPMQLGSDKLYQYNLQKPKQL